jgi:hypothetical protein
MQIPYSQRSEEGSVADLVSQTLFLFILVGLVVSL